MAARRAKSAGLIGRELAKALNRLGVAFAVNRHSNEVKAANFYSQLSDALWGLSADGAKAGMAEGACKQPQMGPSTASPSGSGIPKKDWNMTSNSILSAGTSESPAVTAGDAGGDEHGPSKRRQLKMQTSDASTVADEADHAVAAKTHPSKGGGFGG